MNTIAQMPANARAEIFSETANRKGLADAIIETDFWVCWMLKQLFSIETLSGRLLFKGGTSLSKIFHAINRFSEDIDLAVDYAALGFTGDRDPRQETISRSRRTGILAEMMSACERYIGGEFLNVLRARCEEILGTDNAWNLEVDAQDPNTVRSTQSKPKVQTHDKMDPSWSFSSVNCAYRLKIEKREKTSSSSFISIFSIFLSYRHFLKKLYLR